MFSPAGWDNEKKISILYENLTSMKPEDDYSDVITRPATRSVVGSGKAVTSAGRDAAETHAEDEQTFLSRLLQQLQQQQPPQAVGGMGVGAVNGSVGSGSPANSTVLNTSSGGVSSAGGTPIRGIQVQKPVDRRASSTIPNQVRAVQSNEEYKGLSILLIWFANCCCLYFQMDTSKSGIGGTSEGVLANFFNSLLKKSSATAAPPGLLPSGGRLLCKLEIVTACQSFLFS